MLPDSNSVPSSIRRVPIHIQNASQLTQIRQLGYGRLKGTCWLNARTLSVSITVGMWEYSIDGTERHIGNFLWNDINTNCPIEYSSHNNLIAANSTQDPVGLKLWDFKEQRIRFAFKSPVHPDRWFQMVGFSPDGKFVAAVDYFSTCVWDTPNTSQCLTFAKNFQ